MFVAPTATGYSFINWYLDPEKTIKIKATEGLAEDITVYARWVEGDNEPTMLVTNDNIQDVFANPENVAANNGWVLFDGEKEAEVGFDGLYGAGAGEWYGMTGDSLTIIFKEELEIQSIIAWGIGNWSLSTHTFYDNEGNVVYVKEDFAFNGLEIHNGYDEDGDGDNYVFEPTEEMPSIKVKKIVILLTQNKWDSLYTNKFCEYEIEIANPNYIDPDA
jgi:uncharacterized repeat protein (TIGR02543 family)